MSRLFEGAPHTRGQALPDKVAVSGTDLARFLDGSRADISAVDGGCGQETKSALQHRVSNRDVLLFKRPAESERRQKTGYGAFSIDLGEAYGWLEIDAPGSGALP